MAKRQLRVPRGAARTHQHEGAQWEPVWQGTNEPDATVVAGGLEADGIRARALVSRLLPSVLPQRFPTQTWTVFVPASHAEEARRILRHRGSGSDVVESERDLGSDQRATLKFAGVGLLVLLVFALFQVLMNSITSH